MEQMDFYCSKIIIFYSIYYQNKLLLFFVIKSYKKPKSLMFKV